MFFCWGCEVVDGEEKLEDVQKNKGYPGNYLCGTYVCTVVCTLFFFKSIATLSVKFVFPMPG